MFSILVINLQKSLSNQKLLLFSTCALQKSLTVNWKKKIPPHQLEIVKYFRNFHFHPMLFARSHFNFRSSRKIIIQNVSQISTCFTQSEACHCRLFARWKFLWLESNSRANCNSQRVTWLDIGILEFVQCNARVIKVLEFKAYFKH